ncbi:MAG: anthranilate phosphoribosyltransferase [Rhizobiaceae bacterium]|jgi:anthranilate phosphoribosyltransferase|nr:anthranilate phosphoribosyltransferase [Rhizobiaceae bacterium]
MDAFKPFIAKAASGAPLAREEAEAAFGLMMDGEATAAQIGGFLMALRVRGETVGEIAAAVSVMRARMTPVRAPGNAIDIVGTGGDASGSYNVSTASAFVVAGCGVPVAKHGNRALSSLTGAADVLAQLGVNIDAVPDVIARCIAEAGIGFMFAPKHHSAMRHVGPARVELGTRTIFNLLGPMSNPAGVKRQLLGVFSPAWLEPMAETLAELGSQAVWVVHGDGMDEMTTSGETDIVALENGAISRFRITPEEVGLARVSKAALKGGDGAHNAAALRSVLQGEAGPYRDIVLLNSGAALMVAGKAADLHDGIEQARRSIASGAALATLEKLVTVSNG